MSVPVEMSKFVGDNAKVVHYDIRIVCGDVTPYEFTELNMFRCQTDADAEALELTMNSLEDPMADPTRSFVVVPCLLGTIREHDEMVRATWEWHCNNHP